MKHIQIVAILLLSTFFAACCDDDNNSSKVTYPTSSEFNAFRDSAMADITKTIIFKAEDGLSYTSASGCVLTIPANCLTLNSSTVTGSVTLEYAEIFDAGTMLVTNKATMGTNNSGEFGRLESGGEFYVNVTQNGKQLTCSCGYSLNVPTSLSGSGTSGISTWTGTINSSNNLTWAQDTTKTSQSGSIDSGNSTYYCIFQVFGWINLDRFCSYTGEKSTIAVNVPTGYTGTNSGVYLLVEDKPYALTQLYYDSSNSIFSTSGYKVPVGYQVYMIFVSEKDGKWIYAIKNITIAAEQTGTFTTDNLNTIDKDALIALIKGL